MCGAGIIYNNINKNLFAFWLALLLFHIDQ